MKKVLIIIDYINEICHPDGKLAAKGYSEFIQKNNTIDHVNKNISQFRANGDDIIFIKVAFKKGYSDQPKNSPLFGKANEYGVLENKTWGTEFLENLDFRSNDTYFIKNRVSAFCSDLNIYLQEKNISDLYLCGCATDLAVEGTARQAHDMDYNIFILEKSCAAANMGDHKNSLNTLGKIATIL